MSGSLYGSHLKQKRWGIKLSPHAQCDFMLVWEWLPWFIEPSSPQ